MTTEQRPQLVTPIPASTRSRTAPPYGLDPREMEVLFLLREGLFVQQIAEELVLPRPVIEDRIGSLLTKMNARSKTEAAVIAIREGIFSSR